MPKTKFQSIIFTLLMAFAMVYVLICYNIALDQGGLSNQTFVLALHELIIMWPIAFLLEMFVVEKAATVLAFRFVTPKQERPIFILLAMSSMIVCLMCPLMSFVATILFKNPGAQLIPMWLQTTAMNFPVALCWQVFYAGPLVRLIFGVIFRKQLIADVVQEQQQNPCTCCDCN